MSRNEESLACQPLPDWETRFGGPFDVSIIINRIQNGETKTSYEKWKPQIELLYAELAKLWKALVVIQGKNDNYFLETIAPKQKHSARQDLTIIRNALEAVPQLDNMPNQDTFLSTLSILLRDVEIQSDWLAVCEKVDEKDPIVDDDTRDDRRAAIKKRYEWIRTIRIHRLYLDRLYMATQEALVPYTGQESLDPTLTERRRVLNNLYHKQIPKQLASISDMDIPSFAMQPHHQETLLKMRILLHDIQTSLLCIQPSAIRLNKGIRQQRPAKATLQVALDNIQSLLGEINQTLPSVERLQDNVESVLGTSGNSHAGMDRSYQRRLKVNVSCAKEGCGCLAFRDVFIIGSLTYDKNGKNTGFIPTASFEARFKIVGKKGGRLAFHKETASLITDTNGLPILHTGNQLMHVPDIRQPQKLHRLIVHSAGDLTSNLLQRQ